MSIEWLTFGQEADLIHSVADAVSATARHAVAVRGRGMLALPGGKTPVPIYRALSDRKLGWSSLVLVPTDERLVPNADPRSNAQLLRTCLSRAGATIVPLDDSQDDDPGVAGNAADQRLRTLGWPPDLVWLGMGEDGHTASILPGPDFDAALNVTTRAVGVRPDPLPREAPLNRVTLSRAAIVSARALILTITGDKKRAVAAQAIDQGRGHQRLLAACSRATAVPSGFSGADESEQSVNRLSPHSCERRRQPPSKDRRHPCLSSASSVSASKSLGAVSVRARGVISGVD